MDLAEIREIYNKYSLYYVTTNIGGYFTSIMNLQRLWKNDKFIVIPSLHLAGDKIHIEIFWTKLGYDKKLLQIELDKGFFSINTTPRDPLVRSEMLKISNILSSYSKSLDNNQKIRITSILQTIKQNFKNILQKPYLPKRKLDTAPDEKTCSDALIRYRSFWLPWNQDKNIIEYLMEQPPSFITNVLGYHGINKINGTIDVFYDLAFLLNRYNHHIIHNKEDVSFLSSLNIDQLISLVIDINIKTYYIAYDYKAYPWGHACLLYGVLTGMFYDEYKWIFNSLNIYNYLLSLEPYKISALKYFIPSNLHDYPPYQCVGKYYQPNDDMLQLINLKSLNVNALLDQYEMIMPAHITDPYDQYYYFAINLVQYQGILNRDSDFPAPPQSLLGYEKETANNILSFYTDRELINYYPIIDEWSDRSNLINLIWENYRGSTWRRLTSNCKNDDTFNVIEGELHGDINKNNSSDLTFSYGTYHDYRCYQASELEASFYEDEEGFHFNVPDYVNPLFGIRGTETKEFPAKSMHELLEIITEYLDRRRFFMSVATYVNAPDITIVTALSNKIILGLSKINLVQQELASVVDTYESFSESDKQWATIYLVWLFFFSMWIRFWKGPGYEYPYQTKSDDYCTPATRDENVILQLYVRNAILEQASTEVRQWIISLPLVKFDWKHPEVVDVKLAGTLERMILNVQSGKECQGIAGDTLSAGTYSLIKYMFSYNIDQFNEFINQWMPLINQEEKAVILRESLNTERLTLLNTNIIQPPFDPSRMEYTQHVD